MKTHLDQDAMAFRNLNVNLQAKKDLGPRVKAELQHFMPMAAEVDNHFKSLQKRLHGYVTRLNDLMNTEAIARGDGNGKALKNLRAKMSTLLQDIIAEMQPLQQEIPEASAKFQESIGAHLLNLMDRKCSYVKEFFYKGESINATQNREAFAVLSGEELEGESTYWRDGVAYWDGNMTGISQQDGDADWVRLEDEHEHGYQVVDTTALAKSCNHTTLLGCVKAKLLQRSSMVSTGFLGKNQDSVEKARQQYMREVVNALNEPF
jgi:hypothetical protein